MKNWLSYIVVIAAVMSSFNALAVEAPHDTIYFYKTWEQMLTQQPDAYLEDPFIEMDTPYSIYLFTADKPTDKLIRKEYIAATMGDSIWLINSEYLKKSFGGDADKLNGYIPVFFNDKVAFMTYVGYGQNLSVTQKLFGTLDDEIDYSKIVDIYYIDFLNHTVLKVTPSALSGLLERYHDLQMRYEGMKDYKKREIIHDYFYKFVDRVTEDIMRPYILDLTN